MDHVYYGYLVNICHAWVDMVHTVHIDDYVHTHLCLGLDAADPWCWGYPVLPPMPGSWLSVALGPLSLAPGTPYPPPWCRWYSVPEVTALAPSLLDDRLTVTDRKY